MFQPYACESYLSYVTECVENGLFLLSCRKGFYGMEFAEGKTTLLFGKVAVFWVTVVVDGVIEHRHEQTLKNKLWGIFFN